MSSIALLNAVLQSPKVIIAELSADWSEPEMPDFRLDPGPIKSLKIKHAGFYKFAESSAYFLDGDCIHFFLSQQLLAHNQLATGEPVFIVGDFNGWAKSIGDLKWRLETMENPDVGGLQLSVPLADIDFSNGTGFKFVSNEGHWFSIPASATNIYYGEHGHPNYYVDLNRSGRHLLLIETSIAPSLSKDYFLTIASDGSEEHLVSVTLGEFFLNIGSKLSLGAVPLENFTLFRIFAPRASSVTLILLDSFDDWGSVSFHDLTILEGGVWEVVIDENLTGAYYWYRLNGPSKARNLDFDPGVNVLDPYAMACVNRWGPGIVIDKSQYPEPRPFQAPSPNDLIIGEVHVRDLIAKAPIEISDQDRLRFNGLTHWIKSDACYLKEWGVNAVELLPISENDAQDPAEYHWGYMPVNYFSPESSYGSDPFTGKQVEEFKELVDLLHETGLAVILDVVYNHVGQPPHLQSIDKLYYFELKADGTLSNWSGCGNDFRSGTPMAKRLIIESLLHQIEFYGVDGFRFDLAELIGLDTLQEIEAAILAKYPNTILISEPWSFRGHIGLDLKHSHYLSWNDGFRDFMKQYVLGKSDRESLEYFLKGSPEQSGKPWQSINYTESHDDRAWIDDITENADHNGHYPTSLDRRRTHLMVSLLMMSIGTPMLAAGQDFMRSKWGISNTYQRGDLNALDYERQVGYPATHEYFRRWIEFRKSDLASILRLKTFPSKGYFEFVGAETGSGLAALYNAHKSSGTIQLFYAVNPMDHFATYSIEDLDLSSEWRQLADSERFEPEGVDTAKITLKPPLSLPPVSCALWVSEIK